MPLSALTFALMIAITPPVAINHPVSLTFVIVNDDQTRTIEVEQGDFIFGPPSDFIQRDNVYLRGWFTNLNLTTFHDFDSPILNATTIYAEWDYLNPAVSLAQIVPSEIGNRFESKTMTLSFPLYEPLKENVRFQWQSAPQNSQDFQNIGGANEPTFSPFRNGTFQYRIRYRIPLYNASGTVIDYIAYFSSALTITIYGQQSITGYLITAGLMLLFSLIVYVRTKRKVYYEVAGGTPLSPHSFRVGEDISLQPKAKKKGYRFIGWYLDPKLENRFEGFRMPLKSIKLYAKFKKTKANR
jgi:hypothetical protein